MTDPDDAMDQNEIYNKAVMNNAARQSKAIAEKNAAVARLEQYQREQGLVPSDKNIREITNFIESSFSLPQELRGRWTVCAVDFAVNHLSKEGRLEFRKSETAAPVVEQPAAVILSDGSRQLPLGTIPSSRHSVVQLRDLDQRERAARGRGGWHGAKF